MGPNRLSVPMRLAVIGIIAGVGLLAMATIGIMPFWSALTAFAVSSVLILVTAMRRGWKGVFVVALVLTIVCVFLASQFFIHHF